MAFCTNCGASVEGEFCVKCGTRIGSPEVSSNQSQPSSPASLPTYASSPTPVAPLKKKRGPLFWVLLGCGGLVVIGAVIITASVLYFMHVAKQAGIDPELMKKNPALATAKIMASMNPNIEIVSVDEVHGILKVRDKKTGKIMNMNLADAQKGKISFEDEQGKKVEIQAKGEGDKASLEIKSPEGSLRMGGTGGQLPDWLPSYPRAVGSGTFALNTKEGNAGSFTFLTKDAAADVASFYEEALKNKGFEVQRTPTQAFEKGSVILITAKESSSQRSATVSIAAMPDGTTVNLAFEAKK
ncbi:MAG: zinc ribbon domain-containing protein [Acidobacteriota bacterium]|jgi:hypothetical protein